MCKKNNLPIFKRLPVLRLFDGNDDASGKSKPTDGFDEPPPLPRDGGFFPFATKPPSAAATPGGIGAGGTAGHSMPVFTAAAAAASGVESIDELIKKLQKEKQK